MSDSYKIRDNERAYFITMTIVGWIDVFTRKEQKLLMVNSLKYCQEKKGLEIYAWCLMPSHLHIICRAGGEIKLTDILRDLKKFTSKAIVKKIIEEHESRRECLPGGRQGCCNASKMHVLI